MRRSIGIAFLLMLLASNAQAIDIWHSNTTWAGQGMCSYAFTLDAEGSDAGIEKFTVEILLLDESGKDIDGGHTAILDGTLGDSNATRYGQFCVDGDCGATSFGVKKATGVVSGKTVDFLKEKNINPRPFEPLKIRLASPTAETGKIAFTRAQCPEKALKTYTVEGVNGGVVCGDSCHLTIKLANGGELAMLADQEAAEKAFGEKPGKRVSVTYALMQYWEYDSPEETDPNGPGFCTQGDIFRSGKIIK